MAKLGGQKLPKRGSDASGVTQVKGSGKGGANIKSGGMGKRRENMKNGNC